MRSRFISLFLLGAFLLALGHTMLPHHHLLSQQQAVCAESHPSTDLLNLLGIVLSHDLGEGHLEHFQKGKNDSALLNIYAPLPIQAVLFHIVDYPSQAWTSIPRYAHGPPIVLSPSLGFPLDLRGPPSC